MKLSKQKIEEIKQKTKNIKDKIMGDKTKKVPKKYYTLLILMIMLGMLTLNNNIKQYNEASREDYIEYNLKEQTVDPRHVDVVNYITDQSSISTNISNMDEAIETISSNSNKVKDTKETKYIMPVNGEILKEHATQKLVYSETLGMWKTHPGIDIKAKLNDKVKSASNGRVQEVEQDNFYGYVVRIVDSTGYTFVYSNLDKDILVKQGDDIKQGNIIGTVGVSATGELADETHLHFEVIKDGLQLNPLDLIN